MATSLNIPKIRNIHDIIIMYIYERYMNIKILKLPKSKWQ